MKPETYFAKPDRSSPEDIKQENKLLLEETTLLDVLGAISGITAILDENRQIIYANDTFVKLLGLKNIEPILGTRPGEAIGCIHAGEMASGCGTAEACTYCGAINSILQSQKTGKKSVRETRITSEADGKLVNWDLRVTTSPVNLRKKNFYVFSVEDISDEKRRATLEKIFFHDILNSAGNLSGLISLLKEGSNPEEEKEIIDLSEESSKELIDEILIHRQLRAAESGELVVKSEEVHPGEILHAMTARISRNEVSTGKNIIVNDKSGDTILSTDKIMLQQVLFNMLKNALEATENEGVVSASIELLPEVVRFIVKNDQVMTDLVRLQIFQRSFSTKGNGRGIGTYSIKLLTESYLNGKAQFSSTAGEGTKFWIDLPLDGK